MQVPYKFDPAPVEIHLRKGASVYKLIHKRRSQIFLTLLAGLDTLAPFLFPFHLYGFSPPLV